MKKSTMIGLVKGNKIQHKKSGLVLTVITVTDEGVQCEEKFISTSNCTRWFDLVEQPVEDKPVEDKPVQPKFKLGDKVKNGLGQIGEVVSVPHLVSYNGRLVMDGYRVRFTDDGETFIKSYSETYEGLTLVEDKPVQPVEPIITEEKTVEVQIPKEHTGEANNKVVEGKNSIDEIFSQFSKVLDNHNAYFKQNKEYVAVKSPRKKGTLLQVVRTRKGSVHVDIKKSVWRKLKDAYKVELEKTYSAYVYDKSRGYIRLRNMEDVNTFTVLLLVALS